VINGKECVLKQIWQVGRIEKEYTVVPSKHHTRQYSPGCTKHEKNSELIAFLRVVDMSNTEYISVGHMILVHLFFYN